MSQVNFFMTTEDERAFFEALSARGDTVIHAGRFFASSDPPALSELPALDRKEPFFTLCHATLRLVYPPLQLVEGPFRGRYHYEAYGSAHIEWHRAVPHRGVLVNGRIHAKVGWLRTDEDNRAFRRWYGSIERWLKKRLRCVDETWWIAPEAEAWSREGGLLAFGDERALRRSLKGDLPGGA